MLDMNTKEILGYKVEAFSGERAQLAYTLTGARGAIYDLIRTVDNPDVMFVANSKGRTCGVKGNYWFTDVDGVLTTIS